MAEATGLQGVDIGKMFGMGGPSSGPGLDILFIALGSLALFFGLIIAWVKWNSYTISFEYKDHARGKTHMIKGKFGKDKSKTECYELRTGNFLSTLFGDCSRIPVSERPEPGKVITLHRLSPTKFVYANMMCSHIEYSEGEKKEIVSETWFYQEISPALVDQHHKKNERLIAERFHEENKWTSVVQVAVIAVVCLLVYFTYNDMNKTSVTNTNTWAGVANNALTTSAQISNSTFMTEYCKAKYGNIEGNNYPLPP